MEWKPIETAPKDGTKILIWGYFQNPMMTFLQWDELGAPEVSYFCNGKWNGPCAGAHDEYIVYQPTHWMPLPKPPVP